MASYRLQRIASRIKFLVGTIIQRELSDPRVGLVTVLRVEVTDDLKEAKVFLSIFGRQGERSRTIRALEDARGFVQKEVGKNLETRNTPRLRFILEDVQDKVSRIETLVVEAKEKSEGDMAKKPGKKDDKSAKDEKTSRSAKPSSKPEKKGAEKSSRVASKDEAKGKKDEERPKRPPKDGDEEPRKFDVDDMGDEEEKDYPDEFEADDEEFEDDEEEEDDDDLDEEEEEESEEDEDF